MNSNKKQAHPIGKKAITTYNIIEAKRGCIICENYLKNRIDKPHIAVLYSNHKSTHKARGAKR